LPLVTFVKVQYYHSHCARTLPRRLQISHICVCRNAWFCEKHVFCHLPDLSHRKAVIVTLNSEDIHVFIYSIQIRIYVEGIIKTHSEIVPYFAAW